MGHLAKAMNHSAADPTSAEVLYICFASAHANADSVPVTPNIIALGNETTKGMNERLLPWFRQHKRKHFGIVLLDFYHSQPELVEAIIGM
ncbi:hypothetical protein B0H15DRAFT_948574 [Mycena belliarum]|uniref:Uncharacterized protein n=1 Tax=Mycena belliarum TaxID=1033014 RepID=A0AAD6U6L0_9AGAR|nr:hypothetical protein B0H15DRAFT_948574 [Mycena belliae]